MNHPIRNHFTVLPSRIGNSFRFPRRWMAGSLALGLFALAALRADELTGLSPEDERNMIPVSTPHETERSSGFLPLPSWSHLVSMPALPDVLKPMGKKTPAAIAATAAPKPPLAPPKDGDTTVAAVTKPAPVAPAPSPALMAVSPFLQWIKSNPQAAAAEARQQANAYQAAPNRLAPNGPGNGANDESYWLPPLIDSAPVNAPVTSVTPGGSAAIYSTPQR